MLGLEYILFAGLIGLIAFALLMWYKKTPRATLPRKESEMLAEKEAKLFKLYQNLEDMMDSFENYVEQETAHIGKQSESIRAAEVRVDELADRIEKVVNDTEDKYKRASEAADKAEILATDVTTELRRLRTETREAADKAEAAQAAQAALAAKRPAAPMEQKQAEPAAEQAVAAQPEPPKQEAAGQIERVLRKLVPVVARPAEGEEQQAVVAEPVQQQAMDADLPFTPIVNNTATTAQAQLVKKIAAARRNREEAARLVVEPVQQAGFEAVLPEYGAAEEAVAIAGGGAGAGSVASKYQTYSRPAPMKQASEMDHVLAAASARKAEAADDNKETSRKQQVLELHNGGMTAEQISRELGVAKGAISFILDLQGKLQ